MIILGHTSVTTSLTFFLSWDFLNILIEDYNFTNFQAIMLGSDQGRSVYKKKLINLVERYNLNKKVQFINHCKEMLNYLLNYIHYWMILYGVTCTFEYTI